MLRAALMAIVSLITAAAHAAEIPDGIPRSLAQQRAARVSDLHYRLSYNLVPHAPTADATEELRFDLSDSGPVVQPLLLDFRDGTVASVTLNGFPVPPTISHGHLVLPAETLRSGPNTLEVHFTANIGPAGKAITRFEDHDDGQEYLYTLFVPMDASMAFPCFDQPDLKARFNLTITAPENWNVISNTFPVVVNGELLRDPAPAGTRTTAFSETEPIPTYLFAFAAGPFVNVLPAKGMPNVWVRKSKAQAAESEVSVVQTTAAQGIQYLSTYFAQPFPFPKYEMVLIPGFAYGGMEHAGCTFLREESVLFRTAPTALNRLNRNVLVLHELTHQWFGDFVTMRWFDDLWLKEGFAQYMAYKSLAALRPNGDIWQHFYQSIKPAAYAIDETQGTTPIYQEIPNLDSAKSAYGAIVYSKAPGVLRQLNYVIGDEAFERGLQLYLAQHKYGNATWTDLIQAFESASGRNLTTWADMWIRHRGMPRVNVSWSCQGPALKELRLTQQPLFGGNDLWPIATEVALGYPDGTTQTLRAELDTQTTAVPLGPQAPACPAWVFANNNDHAYGLFLLDPKSRSAIMQQLATSQAPLQPHEKTTHRENPAKARFTPQQGANSAPNRTSTQIDSGSTTKVLPLSHFETAQSSHAPTPAMHDLFRRTLLWGSLWDSVREAELDPAAYTRLALEALPNERDESLAASLLSHTQTAAHHYVSDPTQPGLLTRAADLAADRMTNDPDHDLRIVWFRALPGFAAQPPAHAVLKDILAGKRTIPGVDLRQQDRWSLVTALIAYTDPEADALLEAEKKRDPSGDGLKYAWVAQAARPSATTKQHYFADFTRDPALDPKISEDWIQSSLGAFNYWNQSALTAPYLEPALEALPQVKRNRKIFFLVAWLDAFLDGQQSKASLDLVNHYLATASPDPDLRLKILEAEDELARTVRIRAKFAPS